MSWLIFAITMKPPAAVRTRMYHVEKMDTGKANGLSRELASLPGVHEALVLASELFPNVTVPGPLTGVHNVCSAGGDGSPSSVAVPASEMGVSTTAVLSAPAKTFGGMFGDAVSNR